MSRSRQLDLSRYDTDKIPNRYLDHYDPVLAPLVDREVKLLEIGVHKGGSLLLWRDYFSRGVVVGIDRKLPPRFEQRERLHLFEGDQADIDFLSDVAAKTAPGGYDIIIDDGAHIGQLAKTTFWHLFEQHLKPGGLYAIEDWGTGYWDAWPDGKSADASPGHCHGMVGFVKELIDEQGAMDMTRKNWWSPPGRSSKFESMLFVPSIVFVKKRTGV